MREWLGFAVAGVVCAVLVVVWWIVQLQEMRAGVRDLESRFGNWRAGSEGENGQDAG